MANEEFKTTVISYDEREVEQKASVFAKQETDKPNVQNILFNITTKVPHVTETLPAVQVETSNENQSKKTGFKSIEQINKNANFIPKFYLKEYKRSARLVIVWLALSLLCLTLVIWAMVAIIRSNVSNWAILSLIPPVGLVGAFTVIYINNWINFKNEGMNVDFSKGKIPTINVMKLYKRLKTAHINVNWFCGLTYAAGGLTILFTYLIAAAMCYNYFAHNGGINNQQIWWIVDPNYPPFANSCGPALLITVIVSSIAMISAFILHIVLLVTNYTRAAEIDNFYSVQIVSDEELQALKKHKNKRDMFIFLLIVLVFVLIGMLIYKLVKSRKQNNSVTINTK